jgi:LPS export ABC transporter protein LptC
MFISNRYSVLLLIVFYCLIIASCTENKVETEEQAYESEYSTPPDQISKNISVIFIDSSYTKAVLTAKRALIFNARSETLLDGGLQIDFFSKATGNRISRLTADSAKIEDKTKDMLARGNVVVIADSAHATLKTSLLQWNNTTQKLYSTEYVEIMSPTETIRGFGFESDLNLTNYKIFKVSGVHK